MNCKTFLLSILMLFSFDDSEAQPTLILKNVNVVDVATSQILKGHTVIISGNRIISVTADTTTQYPDATRIIGATGKFLTPGLWDMHVHSRDLVDLYPLFVANGVTGIRDMGYLAKMKFAGKWRDRINAEINSNQRIAPRMQAVAGHIIDGPEDKRMHFNYQIGRNATEGKQAVKMMWEVGADFIKPSCMKKTF